MILDHYNHAIVSSNLYKQTIELLPSSITQVRCLALGPLLSVVSLYQLSYIHSILKHLNAPVSLYDPVFTADDKKLLRELDMVVEESFVPKPETLYFLPHAPLDVTEQLVDQYHPKYLLCNHMMRHTERLPKRQLHDKYPNLSHLVHLLDNSEDLDFIIVRRTKVKLPVIEYTYDKYYFDNIEIKALDTEGAWVNAFSDLQFHIINSN